MAFIRYRIEISNTVGRTKGHINLIIHQSPHETHVIKEVGVLKNTRITTNAVKKEEFGEHVARMHALNNKGFITQYQVSHDHHTCPYIITMLCSDVCCLYTNNYMQALDSCEEGKFFSSRKNRIQSATKSIQKYHSM